MARASHGRDRRRHQHGVTLIELMISTTLMATLSVFMLSAGTEFSQTLLEQEHRTDVYTQANVLRSRVLGDARRAASVLCPNSDTFSLTLLTVPPTFVEYHVIDGDLMRWSLPPDHEVLVAEDVETLSCTSLGLDGLFVSVAMGTTDHPFHMHVRVSSTGS